MPRSPSAASVMSREVTTLLLALRGWGLGLGLSLGLGLRRGSRALVVVPLHDGLVRVLHHDTSDYHYDIAVRHVHDLHTLRVTAGNPNPFDRDADHDALLGDHHQLVVRQHLLQRHDIARLFVALQRNDAAT